MLQVGPGELVQIGCSTAQVLPGTLGREDPEFFSSGLHIDHELPHLTCLIWESIQSRISQASSVSLAEIY